jgi:hypothetical protein
LGNTRRGAFQPYFIKQSEFLPYFPQELKITVLRDISKWRVGDEERIGACIGLIFPHFSDPYYSISLMEDRCRRETISDCPIP